MERRSFGQPRLPTLMEKKLIRRLPDFSRFHEAFPKRTNVTSEWLHISHRRFLPRFIDEKEHRLPCELNGLAKGMRWDANQTVVVASFYSSPIPPAFPSLVPWTGGGARKSCRSAEFGRSAKSTVYRPDLGATRLLRMRR